MTSIFEKARADAFTYYRAKLQFQDKIIGGIPKSPKVIEGWLRTKAMITDEAELQAMAKRTLLELGVTSEETAEYEDVVAAADAMASERHTNGFKKDDGGLYIESRIIKSMIKENANIRFAGTKKGVTRKGFKNYVAERIFIVEDRVHLGVAEPDGVELQIAHVTGPQGPRSSLTNVEFVQQPAVTFTIKELKATPGKDEPSLSESEWADLWVCAEENGLGASRSQSHGRFRVLEWESIPAPTP